MATAKRSRRRPPPGPDAHDPVAVAIIMDAVEVYRSIVPDYDAPGAMPWVAHELVYDFWEALDAASRRAVDRHFVATGEAESYSRNYGRGGEGRRFGLFVAGCANGVELDARPTPEPPANPDTQAGPAAPGEVRVCTQGGAGEHLWSVRRNEGDARLAGYALCSGCGQGMAGVAGEYVSLTIRSPGSISFACFHRGCLPPTAPPEFTAARRA